MDTTQSILDNGNNLAADLINNIPDQEMRPKVQNLRSSVYESMNNFKKSREAERLQDKNKISETALAQIKKPIGKWQKFKNGLGKFWQYASKPVKGLLNLVPGFGSTLSKGVDVLERVLPQTSSAIEALVSRRRK